MSQTITNQITLPSDLPFPCKPIINLIGKLPTAREGWEVALLRRKDGTHRRGLRAFEDVTKLSIHHTAVEGGTPTGHANFHIKSKGRPGIAYHTYVKGDQLYLLNDLLALTFHTANNNFDTVSISVEGNFTKRDLTEVERKTLYAGILTLKSIFPNINVIKGHKEFPIPVPTSCPGFDMNRVRKDILALEHEMDYRKSALNDLETASKVMARVQDLYRKAIDPKHKYNKHAVQKMHMIEKDMREDDLFNTIDMVNIEG